MDHTQLQHEPEPELSISAQHLNYIQSLSESPECYARFFDALLIKKSSHADFFHDLKVFREQPAIIALLDPGSKEAFRQCTVVFLGSRFAHPWCRSSAAHASGWTKASWVGRTKKLTEDAKKEEDKLHRLLVPIWIAFRRRMFPEQEVLQKWIADEPERLAARKAEAEARSASEAPKPPSYPELGFATASTPSTASDVHASKSSSGAAAGQMFLGMAVTGFIMSDKRVKKYVEKKLRKNK